jgi:hypothetical protein
MVSKLTLDTLRALSSRVEIQDFETNEEGHLGLHLENSWIPQDEIETLLKVPIHILTSYSFTQGKSVDVLLKIGTQWVEGNVVLVEIRGRFVTQGPPPNWMSGSLLDALHAANSKGEKVELAALQIEIENAANTVGDVVPPRRQKTPLIPLKCGA